MCTCKSGWVVIINGTFVVAMQKKKVLHFHCNHLKLWPCRKGPPCVCLALVLPDKKNNSAFKEATFTMRAHLQRSWLLLDFANSRSPWVDFCCMYHTTDSLYFEEPGIVGGLIRQKPWFKPADFKCHFGVCSRVKAARLQFINPRIHFHMCYPWKDVFTHSVVLRCGFAAEPFTFWTVFMISMLYVKCYGES